MILLMDHVFWFLSDCRHRPLICVTAARVLQLTTRITSQRLQITARVSKGPAGLTGLEATAKQGKGAGIENSYTVGPRQAGGSRVGGGAAAPSAAQVALAGPRPGKEGDLQYPLTLNGIAKIL